MKFRKINGLLTMTNKISFKKSLTILLLLLLTFLSKVEAFAQEADITKGEVLTLERCIDIAINKNPNITRNKNITQIYINRKKQVKASYLPQVNLSTGYNRANQITKSPKDISNNQYSSNVAINQLFYDFGKTGSKSKIQEFNIKSSKADVDNAVVQIAYTVKQSYYSALAAKVSQDIYARATQQSKQHLQQAKAFFQAGTKSKIDVTTADVALSNANFNYIKANNSYKNAIASLNNAMGSPEIQEYNISDTLTFKHNNNITNDLGITYDKNNSKKGIKPIEQSTLKSEVSKLDIIDNLTFKKYEFSLEDSIKKAYENRPDLKSMITRGNVANESIKLAKTDYYPNLSGSANYAFGGQEFPLDNGWSLGANISVPVFNGLLTKNQIAEAKANFEVAKSDIEILKQNIYLQVQQAYINLTEAEKRIPVADLIVKQAKENLTLANGRYRVGVGNSVEVQDAETNYNNAQLSLVQAVYDYNISRSNIEKAMGIK